MRETNRNAERAGYDGVFKALGDEHRLQILRLLSRKELSAGEILESMDIVQSTLSHHMKVLTGCGVVTATRSGKWTIYSVNMEVLRDTEKALADFLREASSAGKSEIAAAALRNKEEAGRAERKVSPVKESVPEKESVTEAETVPGAETVPEAESIREESDTKEKISEARYVREDAGKDGKEKKKGKKSKKSKKNGKK